MTPRGRPRPCREKSNPAWRPAILAGDAAKFLPRQFSRRLAENLRREFGGFGFRNFQRREQKLVGQLEIAFRVVGRDATFVRPEKMDVLGRDSVPPSPIFALACSTAAAKNFCVMRPPESATQCSLPERSGRLDFIQPRAGGARASSSALAKEISSKFFTKSFRDSAKPERRAYFGGFERSLEIRLDGARRTERRSRV